MALGRKPIEIVNEGSHQLLVKAKHWKRIYLRKVAIVQNGYAFSSKNFVKIGGMPLIRIRDIDRELTVDRFDGNYSDQFIVRNGDILIGMDGDFKISKWKGGNALLNQRVCRIIPNSDEFDSNFLFLCMQPFLDAIHQETSSVTVKHLSSRTIEEIPLPFPPLLEQQKIVTKIEELFSQLENGKQQLLTAQKQLKTYRQSLLKNAFEGKLTNTNLKAGELPKSWEVKKLGEVCKLKNGFAFKSSSYQADGVPVIRISDINGGIVSSEDAVRVEGKEDYKNYLVEENDILIAMSGATTGKFGIFKGIEEAYQNQRVGNFKILDEKILNKQFLFYQINSLKRQIEKDAYGGAQPNISSTKIEQMQIVLPPPSEQQKIVAILESKLTICDKIEETIKNTLQQSETLRQSILKKAFEGRLV